MSNWFEVASLEEIPRKGARVVRTRGTCIAVFRTGDDEVFALRDQCPHQGGALSQGIVHGHRVTCPLHSWVIGLEDGEAQGHDEGSTPCYAAKVEDGTIYLALTEPEGA